jgi:chromatin modification-related protein VID21
MANLAAQQQRNGTPNNGQGPSPPSAQTGPSPPNANMQARHPVPGMMQNGLANGAPNGIPAGMQIPQAPMQGMQGQQRLPGSMSQEQMRIAMQQRQLAAAQTQQFGMHPGGQQNSLAAAHLSPANGSMQNPQVLAALAAQRANGMVNGMSQGNSTSPRGPHPNMNLHRPHQLSSGVMPTITYFQQKVQAEYPHFTPDQVMKLAQEQLKGQLQKLTQGAASAAAGMPAMMNNPMAQMNMNAFAQNGVAGNHSPQQYQAQLQRQMQQQGRMSGSPGLGAAQPRQASRSATPQGAQIQASIHQRSGSGTGPMVSDLSESPRLPTAQMTGP